MDREDIKKVREVLVSYEISSPSRFIHVDFLLPYWGRWIMFLEDKRVGVKCNNYVSIKDSFVVHPEYVKNEDGIPVFKTSNWRKILIYGQHLYVLI